jgi:hypothetical protein
MTGSFSAIFQAGISLEVRKMFGTMQADESTESTRGKFND